MIVISGLIWDEWNKAHISKHKITIEEIEDVCHTNHQIKESYRKRILVVGKTITGRLLAIVLSPENRKLESYGNGIYYVVTAFEKETKL